MNKLEQEVKSKASRVIELMESLEPSLTSYSQGAVAQTSVKDELNNSNHISEHLTSGEQTEMPVRNGFWSAFHSWGK
jgi:hypothetical protein